MKNPIAFVLLAAIFSLAGPVSYYGNLRVVGNRIKGQIDKADVEVQLKGPSFYWSDGVGLPFYTSKNVDWFVDTMDVSVIRHAMTVQWMNSSGGASDPGNSDGYLISNVKKNMQKNLIDTMVQAAIKNDIYIIIDWHSHRAQNEQTDAVEFFREMATKYRGIPNVIFEIYNEPPQQSWDNPCNGWGTISGYMNAVTGAIRNAPASNNNLVLVGSPQWSSCPDVASSSYGNVAYTMHFYAGSHFDGGGQRNNSNTALSNGKAVFVSEWGTTEARGDSHVNEGSSQNWMSWMDNNKISSCQWSVSDFEGSSIFKSGSSTPVALNNLSESGKILYGYMGGNPNNNTTLGKTNPPSGWPWARSRTVQGIPIKEGDILDWDGTQLGLSAGAVFYDNPDSPTPGLSVEPNKLTFEVPHQLPSSRHVFNYYIKYGDNISKHRITLVGIVMGPKATVDVYNVNLTGTTNMTFGNLGISHPTASPTTINVSNYSVSEGQVSYNNSARRFTYIAPAGAVQYQQVNFTYTLTDQNGITLTKTVVLVLGGTTPILNPEISGIFGLNSYNSHISVNLAKSGAASLDIYSISGVKIAALMSGHQNAGSYEFNLSNYAKGVYIVRLRQGSEVKTLKMVR